MCNLQILCVIIEETLSLTEVDGLQNYGGYPAHMPMDGMERAMMQDEYPGSVAYERQAY